MNKILLILSIFLLSSCIDSVELPISKEKEHLNTIKKNQEEANKAKEEYKLLQAKSY